MTRLSINLNKIALIRNARDTRYPDPAEFAALVIAAGAHGITVHPRPDQRHIRASDCIALGENRTTELNIEGNPFAGSRPSDRDGIDDYPGFLPLVEMVRPDQVTLVPDSDQQLTSDHGFNITQDGEALRPVIEQLKSWGCRVSLFMDPDPEQIALVGDLGADRIELYTESYAKAHDSGAVAAELSRFQAAAAAATAAGLGINAGHDLNLSNLPDFRIPRLLEVSIGHAFTIDALRFGIDDAIGQYLNALAELQAD